jgi:hypothetical protein
LFLIALAIPAFGQRSPAAANKPAPSTPSKPATLTVDAVLAMVDAGLSDDLIIARLRKEDKPFDLGPDDMIRLKKAKLSDALLMVMLDPKAEPKKPAAEPVVIQRPIGVAPGIARPSGATPPPRASTSGDLNDPMTPHDSGIYLYTKDRDGKPQMIVLERAAYQGAKTGGMLQSAMTYGIVKAKTKALIPGAHATIRVKDKDAVFYFYFDDKQAGLGKTCFGAGNLSNPNQFVLLKLAVTKSNRETTVGQFSALGTSSGSDSKSMTAFKSERIRSGLYKVTVDDLTDGEYCFVAASEATTMTAYGAYGAGAAGAVDVFDFGVTAE